MPFQYAKFVIGFLVVACIGIYAIYTAGDSSRFGRLVCPRCKKPPKTPRERTMPKGGYICEYCECRMDEEGYELSGNNESPDSW